MAARYYISRNLRASHWAFTLAELLISLLILGEIATFTIPKVLISQQNQRNNAVTKEVVSMVTGAYQIYKFNNTVTEDFGIRDLTPYLNYVNATSGFDIDAPHGGGTVTCNNYTNTCLKLHSGAVIDYGIPSTFGGLNPTNAVYFHVDPDGTADYASTTGPGKAVEFWLFYNGRVASRGDNGPVPCQKWEGGGPWCYPADPAQIPPWFIC